MAITDLDVFTHLTDADIENLGIELDAIRQDIEDSRGERDARYIHRTIAAQRALEVAGRLMLASGTRRSAWWAGTATLGMAKIVENMEIGHNVMHGQWDWMNDPEIHSSSWEWDMAGSSKHWRYTHNFVHHKYTNILGMDDDVGYGLLRVTRDHRWRRFNLFNLFYNTMLALGFEWGVGLQHVEIGKIVKKPDGQRRRPASGCDEFLAKAGRQVFKDYVAFPALTALSPGATFKSTLKANAVANLIRNVWANAVIFCGHFPDGAEKFTKTDMIGETQGPVVSAPDAGQCQLRRRPGAAVHERQPVPPDRAPPVPGSAQQPVARDLGAGARAVRQVRLALHHRLFPGAIRQDVADDRQVVAAGQVPARHRRQRPGDAQRVGCSPNWSPVSPADRPVDRTPPRTEDRDRHRAGLAARQAAPPATSKRPDGTTSPPRISAVDVVAEHPIVDAVLDRHRDALGDDLSAYRNHVYRCLTYHQLLLGFSIPDAAALAWATHDLGIWTAGTSRLPDAVGRSRGGVRRRVRHRRRRPAACAGHRAPPATSGRRPGHRDVSPSRPHRRQPWRAPARDRASGHSGGRQARCRTTVFTCSWPKA